MQLRRMLKKMLEALIGDFLPYIFGPISFPYNVFTFLLCLPLLRATSGHLLPIVHAALLNNVLTSLETMVAIRSQGVIGCVNTLNLTSASSCSKD